MKKKVTILALHLSYGGIERASVNLANALVQRGHEVEILSSYKFPSIAYPLSEEVTVTFLSDDMPNRQEVYKAVAEKKWFKSLLRSREALGIFTRKYTRMVKAIRSIESGTVIAMRRVHAELLSTHGKENVEKIWQLHEYFDENEKNTAVLKKACVNMDTLAVLTNGMMTFAKTFLKDTKTQIKYIPNFLPNELFLQDYEAKKEKQCIAIGRFSKEKGFDRLLDMWKIIAEKRDDYTLILVGDGDEKEALEKKALELGIAGSVVFKGYQSYSDMLCLLSKSNSLLLTSHYESFSFVILESFLVGTVPVVYSVPYGPSELIEDKENGLLIPDDEKETFAQAVLSLMDDENAYKKMVIHAKESAKEFSETVVLSLWNDIL